MAHLAIIDANRSGLRLLERAAALGHEVSFLRTDRHRLYGEDPGAAALIDRMHRVVTVEDTADPACVAEALAPIHAARGIDAVLCVNEYAVVGASGGAAMLGLPATSASGVRAAVDKYGLRQRASAEGLACGRSVLARGRGDLPRAMAEIGYPVMVKCARAADSLMAQAVMRPEDQAAALARLDDEWQMLSPAIRSWLSPDFVCETFFEGPLVSAEFLLTADGPQAMVVSQRITAAHDPTIELGTILPAPIGAEASRACMDYAMAVARVAGLDRGACHVELILTPEGPRLVELNPRLMGGSMPLLYDQLAGVHVHDLLIGAYLGQAVVAPPLPPDRQVFSLRLEAAAPGIVVAQPTPEEMPLGDCTLFRQDILAAPGERVAEEKILGRLYVSMPRSQPAAPVVARLLTACEARLGVALMR